MSRRRTALLFTGSVIAGLLLAATVRGTWLTRIADRTPAPLAR